MSIEAAIEKTARDAVDAYLERIEPVAPTYLNPADAAFYLGLSHKQLEAWRHRGDGPAYTKLDRAIRYKRQDLDDFMSARLKGGAS